MNSIIYYAIPTIVVGIFVTFIIALIKDSVEHKQWEKDLAVRDEKQRRLNNLVRGLHYSLAGKRRGFIQCEYAFGRFYIHYECITDCGEHYSMTESFYESGIAWEKYGRAGTLNRFQTEDDMQLYCEVKADLLSIIRKNYENI